MYGINYQSSKNNIKNKIFIGSSSEGKIFADTLQILLEKDNKNEVTIWNQGVFKIGEYTLYSLLEQIKTFDIAIFFFTPDDLTLSREKIKYSVRDNLIFELGLFMGSLGIDRSFYITPKGIDIKIPSDLWGITHLEFNMERKDNNLRAALNECSIEIQERISSLTKIKEGFFDSFDKIHDLRCNFRKSDIYISKEKYMRVRETIKKLNEIMNVDIFNSIIYLDIDAMHGINAKYGKDIGDIVKKQTYEIMQNTCLEKAGNDCFLFDIYTDSFIVVCNNCIKKELAQKIVSNVKNYSWKCVEKSLYVTCSAGVATKHYPGEKVMGISLLFTETIETCVLRAIYGCSDGKYIGGNAVGQEIFFMEQTNIDNICKEISD